jgi:hypothetical protein
MTLPSFDPVIHIENAAAILDNGAWPNFHDAIVYTLNFWRGDCRPDDDVWVMPVIDASLKLAALQFPYVVDLRFHDCHEIRLNQFDNINDIYWPSYSFEARGYYADGVTPLPPYIRVVFERGPGWPPLLEFRCFRVEALGRRELSAPPCR